MEKFRGIFDGAREELEVMDNEIFRCEDRLDQVIMPELDGAGEEEHFGGAIDNVDAAKVMLNPWRLRKSQDLQVIGLLWMMTPHPAGPMRVSS